MVLVDNEAQLQKCLDIILRSSKETSIVSVVLLPEDTEKKACLISGFVIKAIDKHCALPMVHPRVHKNGRLTNSSHTKRVTSSTWWMKAAEAAVHFVANGANPVKISDSDADLHLRE